MDPWTISGRGPQWIGGTELVRAWPPAAPVCKDTGQGAGEGEWNVGNPMVHSPELGRQRGGRAMVVRAAAVRTPMRGALGARRVENGGGGQGWEERLGARGQHCHRKRGFVLIIVIIFTSNNTPTIKGLKSDHITFYLKRYKTL
jgi:hypothetical protein